MKSIDCLIIGHNEMKFEEYESMVGSMGPKSEAYRDLNLNFIRYENKPYTVLGLFDSLYKKYSPVSTIYNRKVTLGDIFSATISYLGSYLHQRGHSFDYVNSFQEEKEKLVEKLQTQNILTVAITTTFYVSIVPILEIVSMIRKHNKNAKIILGGPFVATNARVYDQVTLQYLIDSTNVDFAVFSSQGEATLVKVIDAIKNETSMHEIDNLYFKEKGKFVFTKSAPENNQLSENMVNWNLFADRIGSFARVRTAISCPFSCAFCGFPEHAGKYQTVDVYHIEDELNAIEKLNKVESVHFLDDTFNVPPVRFKEILQMMKKNKYSFKWHSYFRCQFADRETVELMKECGCELVFTGIESGSQQILKNMNKAATVEDYKKGLALLKEYEIPSMASFIIGFPGETKDTFQETMNFIEECQPDFYRAQLWYCEQITPIWQKRELYGIKGSQFKWSHKTMDSVTASNLIEEMVLKIKKSIWLPQVDFDIVGVSYLHHRGASMEQVKEFLKNISIGIQDKIKNPAQKSITIELEQKFKILFEKINLSK